MFDPTIRRSLSGFKFQKFSCDIPGCTSTSTVSAGSGLSPRLWTVKDGKHYCHSSKCVRKRNKLSVNELVSEPEITPEPAPEPPEVPVNEPMADNTPKKYNCTRCNAGSDTGEDWWLVKGYVQFCNKRGCRDYVLTHSDYQKLHRNMVDGFERTAA